MAWVWKDKNHFGVCSERPFSVLRIKSWKNFAGGCPKPLVLWHNPFSCPHGERSGPGWSWTPHTSISTLWISSPYTNSPEKYNWGLFSNVILGITALTRTAWSCLGYRNFRASNCHRPLWNSEQWAVLPAGSEELLNPSWHFLLLCLCAAQRAYSEGQERGLQLRVLNFRECLRNF